MTNWTTENIPNLDNKVFLITGASSGLGLGVAKELAKKGAQVVLAARDVEKGHAALTEVRAYAPSAEVSFLRLDLADLASVRKFCGTFIATHKQLDVLINNAGIMMPNKRTLSKQGYEIQFATNHLGHFLLTSLLLPLVMKSHNARVVTVSSNATNMKFANIHYGDLQFAHHYEKMPSYAQSKMANIMFAMELNERLTERDINVISVAAHPGYTATKLQRHMGVLGYLMNLFLAQRLPMGILPILRAATDPEVKGGEYYGPAKLNEFRGYPVLVPAPALAQSKADRCRLWDMTEELIGDSFDSKLEPTEHDAIAVNI